MKTLAMIVALCSIMLTGCDSKSQEQTQKQAPTQVLHQSQDFTAKIPLDTSGKPMKLDFGEKENKQ